MVETSDGTQQKGWVTEDGQEVKPDEKGTWPSTATLTDENGETHTVVSGPGGETDQV